MTWIHTVLRVLVGAAFVFFGLSYFFQLMDMPPPPTDETKDFMGVLVPTKYLAVVKVLETLGGVLLLTWRFGPLGVVILMPVAVNILLWDVLLAKSFGLGGVLVVLLTILAAGYRRHFAPFFTTGPSG
jgi:uncharacterized membrane protein YphA (DoxX/SURF4 family)